MIRSFLRAFFRKLKFRFHPEPKFSPSHLVTILPCEGHTKPRILIIQARRWGQANGSTVMQWVYDGSVFSIKGDQPVDPRVRIGYPETLLAQIPGFYYGEV